MLYFLHGQDNFRLLQKLQEIESQYAQKNGGAIELQRLDFSQENERAFWDFLNQKSLFVSKKLLVSFNVFSNEPLKKTILKQVKDLAASSNVVVFIEQKNKIAKDKFLTAINENSEIQEFSFLTGDKLTRLVKNEFQKYNSNLSGGALEKLLNYTLGDMWLLDNEIKKLAAFKKDIAEKDVDLLTVAQFKTEIFKTIDNLAQRNKKQVLDCLQKHLDLKESPIYLLSMITYQIRNLIMVKAGSALGANGLAMNPFVFKKSAASSFNFSLQQLKDIYNNIFVADLKIKTGQDSPEGALKNLIAAI